MSKEKSIVSNLEHSNIASSQHVIAPDVLQNSLWTKLHSFYCAHEILIDAIIVGIVIDRVIRFVNFLKKLKQRDSSLGLFIKEFWDKHFAGNRLRPLSKREISNSIVSNLPNLTNESVVFYVDKKSILTNKEQSHFGVNGYHFDRFLNILPALDGGGQFFVDACRSIGDQLDNKDDIDCLVYLDKPSDMIFCKEVAQQSLLQRTKVTGVGYRDQAAGSKKINDREERSLEGQNIVIGTALALSDKPLLDLVEFVRDQRATLVGVLILFNAISEFTDLTTIIDARVLSAFFVDLKPFRLDQNQCPLCLSKPKVEEIGFCGY